MRTYTNVLTLSLYVSLSRHAAAYEITCADRTFVGHVPDPVDLVAELSELIDREYIIFKDCEIILTTDMDYVDKNYLKENHCMYPDKVCILQTNYELLNAYNLRDLPVHQHCSSFFDLYLNTIRYIKTIQETV